MTPRIVRMTALLLIASLMATLAAACSGVAAKEVWTLVELLTQETLAETQTDEALVRNCESPERKTYSCSAGTEKDLAVTLGGSAGVALGGKFEVSGGVSTGLGLGKTTGESLELDTPPEGYVYRYTIDKQFQVIGGRIRALAPDGEEEIVTYRFDAKCSLRLGKPELVPCEEADAAPAGATQGDEPMAGALEVYDSFDDGCLSTNRWSELYVWNGPEASPDQTDACWDMSAWGLEERGGALHLTCANPAEEANRSYTLVGAPAGALAEIEATLSVESVTSGFGSLGLVFDLDGEFAYFSLWYGADWPLGEGRVVFETAGRSGDAKVVPDGEIWYGLPATVTLRLHWDGSSVHFYVDGREVLREPAESYGRILGLVCGTGWNQNHNAYILQGTVQEVKVRYR